MSTIKQITVFLAQSPRTDRWFFTAQSFQSQTMKDLNGDTFECLAPRGNNDLRDLPEDAVTSKILPIEWNNLTRDEVVGKVGATAHLDPISGKLSLIKQ